MDCIEFPSVGGPPWRPTNYQQELLAAVWHWHRSRVQPIATEALLVTGLATCEPRLLRLAGVDEVQEAWLRLGIEAHAVVCHWWQLPADAHSRSQLPRPASQSRMKCVRSSRLRKRCAAPAGRTSASSGAAWA